MIEYKLIALDLDGTSLKEGGWLTETTKNAIEKAISAGYIVVPATGRTLSEIPDEMLSIPGMRFAIIANGASVIDLESDSQIFNDLILLPAAKEIFTMLHEQNLIYEVYSEGVSYCEKRFMPEVVSFFCERGSNYSWLAERIRFIDDLGEYFEENKQHVEKITVNMLEGEKRTIIEKFLAGIPSLAFTSSDPWNLEINTATANKGAALTHLCRKLGISSGQVMAIGDGENDISMLSFSGLPIAMDNAGPTVKQASSYITLSNNDEGVAAAFRKFLHVR